MKLIYTLIALLLYTFVQADVVYQKTGLKDPFGRKIVRLEIQNEINTGDFDEFEKAIIEINQNDYRVAEDSVILNSRGGSMYEAKKIGYLIRYNHLATKVNRFDACASACSFILIAGTCRMAKGRVSLHQSWSDLPAQNLNSIKEIIDWSDNYDEKYLHEMNASQEFIDIVQNTPSWHYTDLTDAQKRRMGLFYTTNAETKYRLGVANEKLGLTNATLLKTRTKKASFFGLFPMQLSCSEQFFMDELENEAATITPNPEENFIVNEVRQFYVRQPNGNPEMEYGKIKEYVGTKVPLEMDNAFVYEISYFAKGKELTYKEVTTLQYPGKWQFGMAKIDGFKHDLEISKDGRVATKTMTVENTGHLMNGWGIDTNIDRPGFVKIEILFNDKLAKTLYFELLDIKSKK